MTPRNSAEAVANGAQWLDDTHPGWWREINLAALDISACTRCICGQLARSAYAQINSSYKKELDNFSAYRGFDILRNEDDYEMLEEEWHKVITARLEADALATFEQKEMVLA